MYYIKIEEKRVPTFEENFSNQLKKDPPSVHRREAWRVYYRLKLVSAYLSV